MATSLANGRLFRIFSLVNNEPVGASIFEPLVFPPPPLPVVIVDGRPGVEPVKFEFEETGEHTYIIRALRRGVTDRDDRIFLVHEGNQEYIIEYREFQRAFTIVKKDSNPQLAWTNPERKEDIGQVEDIGQILLAPLISTRSLPPQFLPSQLFRIEPAEE